MSKKGGSFSFSGTGTVALLAIVVLGGGAFILLRNTNNISIDNKSEGGSVSGINISPNTTQQQQSGSSGPQTAGSKSTTTPLEKTDQTGSESLINIEAANVKWTLKYPIYQEKDGNCALAGTSSVILEQREGGSLYYNAPLSGYGPSGIQGTVTKFGKVDLSIDGSSGKYLVTLEGEDTTIDPNETVIAGKATMLGCPESTFEVRKTN
ncbi:MAG: hypothetical protein F6J96_35460 [Symploca sp. SIO1C2]|nr:hypothetical protein [Symploca sp. SIO1C2]